MEASDFKNTKYRISGDIDSTSHLYLAIKAIIEGTAGTI